MSTTYRSTVFVSVYLGALAFVAAVCFFLPEVPTWGAVAVLAFSLLGIPFGMAKVEINEEGITQRTFNSHSVKWADMLSWERVNHPDSDGPDTIIIKTRAGSFALNHNCIYGKRLEFVESELRRRIAQPLRCA